MIMCKGYSAISSRQILPTASLDFLFYLGVSRMCTAVYNRDRGPNFVFEKKGLR